MKALTIFQPYANLIADGVKWVENRTQYTPYRGPLAIHAGKGLRYLSRCQFQEYPMGVVVAKCNLIGCLFLDRATEFERRGLLPGMAHEMNWGLQKLREFLAHEHTEGPYCWILAGVEKLGEPIPAVGKQGLWNFEYPEVKQ